MADGDDLPGYEPPPPGAARASDSKHAPAADTATATAPGIEHVLALENKGRPWLTLRVQRSHASAPSQLPIFFDGEEVCGVVEVDLAKPESAKAVTIALLAGTTQVGQEELRFLELTHELWPGARSSSSSGGKLSGKLAWPFALRLPETVRASEVEKGPESDHKAPPSFSERAGAGYIDYKVVVTVRRGALRVNQT
jgi:hypothetical protein